MNYTKATYKEAAESKCLNEIQKEYESNINILDSYSLGKESSIIYDFYYLMNSRALILNNSSFSLWAGYMSNSKEIYYELL